MILTAASRRTFLKHTTRSPTHAITSTVPLSRRRRSLPFSRPGSSSSLSTNTALAADAVASSSVSVPVPPEIEQLHRGNQWFQEDFDTRSLSDLAQGQQPPFLILTCSDSRVCEQLIFNTDPGKIFKTANIANQFHEHDLNANAVLAYAVEALKIKHVVVMGHYGCGGVAAATIPPPPSATADVDAAGGAVQKWIAPIREIYETSKRKEIVSHRETKNVQRVSSLPGLHDPAFRALVEENVKRNVQRVARSAVMTKHYASLPSQSSEQSEAVLIHGWVYDIETGEVGDLGITVGPPGRAVPETPFPVVVAAESSSDGAE